MNKIESLNVARTAVSKNKKLDIKKDSTILLLGEVKAILKELLDILVEMKKEIAKYSNTGSISSKQLE